MSQPQLVLDYASPRKVGRVRLPAQSELIISQTPEGEVRVLERLRGRHSAIAAVLFGAFFLISAGMSTVNQVQWVMRHRHWPSDWVVPGFLAILTIAEALLLAGVIQQTWRRTTLVASTLRVTLEFIGPLTRAQRHEWTVADVVEFIPVTTRQNPDGSVLGELQLRPPGMLISLFTDHPLMEIQVLARLLNGAIMGEAPPTTVVPLAPR
jgi:hypothetical protein